MKKVKIFALTMLLMLNSVCAFAANDAIPDKQLQHRLFIVVCIALGVVLLYHYFKKFIIYRVGDLKENIHNEMVKKGKVKNKTYNNAEMNRFKNRQNSIQAEIYRLQNELNQQNLNQMEIERLQQELDQQMLNQEANRLAMEESMRAVTPFDMGGYVQGYGLNPSDTMAGDAQMNMNNMNDMGMF